MRLQVKNNDERRTWLTWNEWTVAPELEYPMIRTRRRTTSLITWAQVSTELIVNRASESSEQVAFTQTQWTRSRPHEIRPPTTRRIKAPRPRRRVDLGPNLANMVNRSSTIRHKTNYLSKYTPRVLALALQRHLIIPSYSTTARVGLVLKRITILSCRIST